MKGYALLLLLVVYLLCFEESDAWGGRRRRRRRRSHFRWRKALKAVRTVVTAAAIVKTAATVLALGKRDLEPPAVAIPINSKCELAYYDKDGDGKLSMEEMDLIHKDAKTDPIAIEKLDKNGNGHIDDEEFEVSIGLLISACQKRDAA